MLKMVHHRCKMSLSKRNVEKSRLQKKNSNNLAAARSNDGPFVKKGRQNSSNPERLMIIYFGLYQMMSGFTPRMSSTKALSPCHATKLSFRLQHCGTSESSCGTRVQNECWGKISPNWERAIRLFFLRFMTSWSTERATSLLFSRMHHVILEKECRTLIS